MVGMFPFQSGPPRLEALCVIKSRTTQFFQASSPNSWEHSSSKRIYHFFFAFHNSSPQHFSTKQPPTLGFSKKKHRKKSNPNIPRYFWLKKQKVQCPPAWVPGFCSHRHVLAARVCTSLVAATSAWGRQRVGIQLL